MRFPAMRHSSCTRTASAGFTCRKVCRTARCRRITSRSSRRCTTRFIRATPIPLGNWFTRQENRFAPPGDPRFPFVLTTYRLTEHHTAGGMSRFLSHLAELQPEMFAEMSPELATRAQDQQWRLHLRSSRLRGAIEARALVSRRIRPIAAQRKDSAPDCNAVSFRDSRPGAGRRCERSFADFGRAERHDHGSQGAYLQHRAWPSAARTSVR